MREHGYDLPDDVLVGAELHELEPALSPAIDAGFLVRQHWHVRSDSFTAGLAAVLRRDGVEIQEGAEVFELVRQGQRLTHVRTGGRRSRGGHRRARGRRLDDTARPLDRDLATDGAGEGLQLLRAADRRALARDPARRRPRRLYPLRRSNADRRDDGVQRHQQPARPSQDRLDRRGGEGVVRRVALAGDRGRVGRHAPDRGRWAADPGSRRCVRERLHRDGRRHAGRHARTSLRAGAGRADHDRTPPGAARAVPARPLPAAPASPRRARWKHGHEPVRVG